MPIVNITLVKGRDRAFIGALSEIIHSAMVDTVNCPPHTRYHAINEVAREDLIYLPEYKGLRRTDSVVLLQITLKEGRTTEQKKAMYERISSDLNKKLGVRFEDVFIILTQNSADDWYFGKAGG